MMKGCSDRSLKYVLSDTTSGSVSLQNTEKCGIEAARGAWLSLTVGALEQASQETRRLRRAYSPFSGGGETRALRDAGLCRLRLRGYGPNANSWWHSEFGSVAKAT